MKKLFTDWSFNSLFFSESFDALGITWLTVVRIVLSVVLLVYIHNVLPDNRYPVPAANKAEVKRSSMSSKLALVFVVLAVMLAWIMLLANDQISSFIYFQF